MPDLKAKFTELLAKAALEYVASESQKQCLMMNAAGWKYWNADADEMEPCHISTLLFEMLKWSEEWEFPEKSTDGSCIASGFSGGYSVVVHWGNDPKPWMRVGILWGLGVEVEFGCDG